MDPQLLRALLEDFDRNRKGLTPQQLISLTVQFDSILARRTDGQISSVIDARRVVDQLPPPGAEVAPTAPTGSWPGTVTRGVAQGVAAIPDLPANIYNMAQSVKASTPPVPPERLPTGPAAYSSPGGGLYSMAGTPPVAPTIGWGVDWLMDKLGVGRPETPAQRMVGAGVTGATAAATGVGAARAIPALAAFGTNPMSQAAGGTAAGLAAQGTAEVGEVTDNALLQNPLAQLIIGMTAGLGAYATGARASAGRAGIFDTPEATQAMATAERQNIPLRAGDVDPRSTVAGIENALERGPGGGMQRVMGEQNEAVSAALRRAAEGSRPAGMLVDDANSFVVDQLRRLHQKAMDDVAPLWRAAEEAALDAPPINTSSAVAEFNRLLPQLELAAPGSSIVRLMKQFIEESKKANNQLVLQRFRELEVAIQGEASALAATLDAPNRVVIGGAKRASGQLTQEMDAWGAALDPESNAYTAYRTAAEAHKAGPLRFREDGLVARVSAGTKGDPVVDMAADKFLNKVLNSGERTKLVMSLLEDEGRQALAYKILTTAADDAMYNTISQDLSPSAAYRALKLRDPARPTAQREVFRGAGMEETAEDVQRMLTLTQRAAAAGRQPSRTGFSLGGATGTAGPAGLGYVLGQQVGQGPAGALIGAGTAPGLYNAATRAVTSPAMVRFMLARKGLGQGLPPSIPAVGASRDQNPFFSGRPFLPQYPRR